MSFSFLSPCSHSVLELVWKNDEQLYRCAACQQVITGLSELLQWQNHVADLNKLRKAMANIKAHREQWKVTLYTLPEGWTEDGATGYRMAMDWVVQELDPLDGWGLDRGGQKTP